MAKFTHLHVHSHYSILDGMSTISGLVDKAVRTGMYSIALTDHGNMFGIKEFFDYVQKYNGNIRSEIKALKEQLNVADTEEKINELKTKIIATEARIFKPIANPYTK